MTAFLILAALIAAVALDKVGLGPRWLSDRLAFVFALAGLYGAVASTPLQGRALSGANWVAQQLAHLAEQASPTLASGIREGLVLLAATAVAVVALAMFLPQRWSSFLGDAVNLSFTSRRIWTVAAALALFGAMVPGWIGQMVDQSQHGATGMTATILRTVLGHG